MKKATMILALIGALGMTSAVHATLIDRGNGMVYDDVRNITWLQNANYANQIFDWQGAVDWADNLVYGGYDDWRLPSSLNQDGSGPCSTLNCTDSEMGYMF